MLLQPRGILFIYYVAPRTRASQPHIPRRTSNPPDVKSTSVRTRISMTWAPVPRVTVQVDEPQLRTRLLRPLSIQFSASHPPARENVMSLGQSATRRPHRPDHEGRTNLNTLVCAQEPRVAAIMVGWRLPVGGWRLAVTE